MSNEVQPDYAKGERVGWHATARHGAGHGVVIDVIVEESSVAYVVQKTIDGKAAGDPFKVDEGVTFRIRSLTDPRPFPATHDRTGG